MAKDSDSLSSVSESEISEEVYVAKPSKKRQKVIEDSDQ